MACGNCGQTAADRPFKVYANYTDEDWQEPNMRAKIMRDLQWHAGGALYLSAPFVIPEDVIQVKTHIGDFPVLHLYRKLCVADGVVTNKPDWEGVHPGTYIEDRAFLLVTVSGLEPITEKECYAPEQRLVKTGKIKVRPLGTIEALWEYRNGHIRRKNYPDELTEKMDESLYQKTLIESETAKPILEKFEDADVEEEVAKVAMNWLKLRFPHLFQ